MVNMKNTLFIILLLLSIIMKAQVSIDTAVNFTGKQPDGQTVSLFPLLDEGKTVMIYFFSDACSTCHLYANSIDTIYDKYGQNEEELFVMAINKDVDNAGISAFAEMYNWEFPYLSGTQGNGYHILHDLYGVSATPTTILIRPDKVIPWDNIYPAKVDTLSYYVGQLGIFPTGVEDKTIREISVFPNPASSEVHISGESILHHTVFVYNALGEQVFRSVIRSESFSICTGSWEKGLYLLQICGESGNINRKLLIQ
jgi:peroxiredoxin